MINFETLRNKSSLKKYQEGTVFSKDSSGSGMYVLLSGQVSIIDSQSNQVVYIVEPGELFDANVMFGDKKQLLNSQADTEVIVIPISKFETARFIENETKFTVEIMKDLYEQMAEIRDAYENDTGHRYMSSNKALKVKKAEINNDKADIEAKVKQEHSTQNTEKTTPTIVDHGTFKLFPEGHTGNYHLNTTHADNVHMCELEYTCPVCNNRFVGLKSLSSKLGSAVVDNDMRKHYKDIEPIYYDVVTCPSCMYSAFSNVFEKPDDIKNSFIDELTALQSDISFKFGVEPDAAAIFAGYYLALFCSTRCFFKPQLMQANLYHKLSWIYHDCQDDKMELEMTKHALEKFSKAYSEMEVSPEAEQQLCMILGELNFKLGNIKEAKNLYFSAKMNTSAPAIKRRKAESRLEELKSMDGEEQTTSEEQAKDTSNGHHSIFGWHKK